MVIKIQLNTEAWLVFKAAVHRTEYRISSCARPLPYLINAETLRSTDFVMPQLLSLTPGQQTIQPGRVGAL